MKLTVTSENSDSAPNIDLPNMNDFKVVTGPNQSTSTSYQFINGKMSGGTTVTTTWTLVPKRTGKLTIPSIMINIDGKKSKLCLGDTVLIKPNQWHKFHTLDGAIFEEVSTTHYNDDSIYEDERIARLPRNERKTQITNWEAVIKDNY